MYAEDFSAKKALASSTSRTKKLSPKRVREAFAKNKSGSAENVCSATGGSRCPVRLLKMFLSHRLEEIKSSGPFYFAVIGRPKCQVWYKRQRQGSTAIIPS